MTDLQDLRREIASQSSIPKDELMERVRVLSKLQEHHSCSRCGRCCIESDPIGMLGSEAVGIAKHLGMGVPEFREQYITGRVGRWLLLRKEEGKPCPFLDGTPGEYRCRIYAARPGVCIAFPWLSHVTIMLTELPKIGISEGMCPNMNTTFRKVQEMIR